ncbi:cell wall synthase accessory phosphoprotein MacP [Streptococcus moroccensis]|uniref:Foldase n=1 Tax=Streptococcus moroccensis TaxID=1451356 RepID=A0ABT9YNV8_9STRE|nr:cell wall synthase accessory phosphoprotein MacP [Streptococcus moroccensis]MDQ0221582.1 hypothetical protein [Streptococcus moroccensis]
MGKPLLTDEMIEQARREQGYEGWSDDQATKEIHFDRRDLNRFQSGSSNLDETRPIQVEPSIKKSRRLENEKRSGFQSKLNQILFVLILLAIALVFAILYL